MKKTGLFFLTFTISLTFLACGSGNDIKPVQSFGNQLNQVYSGGLFIEKRQEIYAAGLGPAGNNHLIKFGIDSPQNQTIVLKEKSGIINQISVLGDWIYFMVEDQDQNNRLYRIKKNGSEKTELLNKVINYVITDKKIYYDPGGIGGDGQIYAMNPDGSNKQQILGSRNRLLGMDHGWIYYYKNRDEDDYLYRIKPDGIWGTRVFHVDSTTDSGFVIGDVIIEKNQVFFTRSDDMGYKTYLVKQTIRGKETIVTTGSITSFNTEGDWIFYSDNNKVYKINADGKSKEQLIYSFQKKNSEGVPVYVDSILLHAGDALVTSGDGRSVYIKQNGTIIELGQFTKQK